MSDVPTIHGEVAPGFGPVADAFRRNFSRHGEIGAAVAVYAGDRPLVDLWAGHRDRERTLPWERDTMAPVFSSTKGMAAFVIAAAVSRGLLDYERPVARYWPEFGSHGKEFVTVRQLLDHQAGLPILDRVVRLRELDDRERVAAILAAQKPLWRPGTRHGYHPITAGLYQGELIRRVDPGGRTLGRIFAEEFAGPLGVDFHIGLPEDVPMERVATLSDTRGLDIVRYERNVPVRIAAQLYTRRGLTYRALSSPRLGAAARAARRELLRLELPASGGVGTARALARVYGAAVAGALPIDAALLDRIAAADTPHEVPADDLILFTRSRYHLGFRKSCGAFRFGSDKRAYGTTGLGGSMGFADPTAGLGFGYVMNRLGVAVLDDARARTLRESLLRCL
ncbi:beta-lactamase family protein [Nocardia terpenica]|uniref:serine hydrolase domain-containing protein n=1 Tax=Nocardia terpenica TaxID=455432 RepID=UPI001893DC20|nr:serine hydrolase domain-containing protein [Nocardia terpenica]MBF6065468.1 beta-lactamase family protein [Nocardia terpenica]MBF6109150.1 beta-lactamase family protein [Nocardia terpenica]MBF6114648.1 beta-lactamase family protein [Nocardia terpenica]MBF6123333.1 beta-lactamase family protein [Nocardia terpenica]MBF6156649.1 beta-lactamase family protein [Nocardia terpenica]